MAQRPWPRPCGCQVPPAPRSLRSPPRSAGRPGRAGEGATAAPPGPRPSFPAPGGLPPAHLHRGAKAVQGRGVSFGPHPTFPCEGRGGKGGGGQEREGHLGLCGRVLLREGGGKCWGEGTELGASPAGSPLLWGEGERGYNGGAEPASGGGGWRGAKPSKPQLRRSALGGGSVSLAGSRLSVLS